MSIEIPESLGERGKQDARRHREKQKEIIKDRLPEIIAEEAIITRKGGKIVKVPIRSIEIPDFRPFKGENGSGIGQGSGEPGDIIGERPAQGSGPGGAGQEPGVDYIETEIEIEELIALMLEDLGLPKLESREMKDIIVELGYKIRGRSKSGPWVLLDRQATAKEGIKRFWSILGYLQKETGRAELVCFGALKQADGNLEDALKLLADPNFKTEAAVVEAFPIIYQEDCRYLKIKKNEKHESRAAVIAMMDVSGSMGTMKKYFARSMLFWLVEFLRQIYARVEIRFIIHHSEAKIVDEETFFQTGESGGTLASKAYELAGNLVDSEYPTKEWNVYLFHFSDGEDFEPSQALKELKKCLDRGINMFGYGQINPIDDLNDLFLNSAKAAEGLFKFYENNLPVKKVIERGLRMAIGVKDMPFLGAVITQKEHILAALKQFLRKDRWQNE